MLDNRAFDEGWALQDERFKLTQLCKAHFTHKILVFVCKASKPPTPCKVLSAF